VPAGVHAKRDASKRLAESGRRKNSVDGAFVSKRHHAARRRRGARARYCGVPARLVGAMLENAARWFESCPSESTPMRVAVVYQERELLELLVSVIRFSSIRNDCSFATLESERSAVKRVSRAVTRTGVRRRRGGNSVLAIEVGHAASDLLAVGRKPDRHGLTHLDDRETRDIELFGGKGLRGTAVEELLDLPRLQGSLGKGSPGGPPGLPR